MSVIADTTEQMCHQKAKGRKTMERRVSTVILNVYWNRKRIELEAVSREPWET